MSGPFKMSGSKFLGKGNQSKKSLNQELASAATYATPVKNESEKTKNTSTSGNQADKDQKTYENTWQSSKEYTNLTKANAPANIIAEAKDKWSKGK